MTVFLILMSFVVIQRLVEVVYAKRNERWMRKQGAIEYGKSHYKWIVLLHIGFLCSIILEWFISEQQLHLYWPGLVFVFFIVQMSRIWVLMSLGRYWNTKILVIPGKKLVSKGSYAGKIRHPNYLIVTFELILLPLIFQSYWTLLVFPLVNGLLLLLVRIPIEEKALGLEIGSERRRFSFGVNNKYK